MLFYHFIYQQPQECVLGHFLRFFFRFFLSVANLLALFYFKKVCSCCMNLFFYKCHFNNLVGGFLLFLCL